MDASKQTETPGQKALNKYATYGLIAGLFIGLVTGILISGPNFSVWPVSSSFLAIAGSGVGGALLGFILSGLALGFTAGGAHDENSATTATSTDGDSGSGDCGGDGGSGTCVS